MPIWRVLIFYSCPSLYPKHRGLELWAANNLSTDTQQNFLQ